MNGLFAKRVLILVLLVWPGKNEIRSLVSVRAGRFSLTSALNVCAADQPSKVTQASSLVGCASACINLLTGCRHFNFILGYGVANCELFLQPPCTFTVVNNCQHYHEVNRQCLLLMPIHWPNINLLLCLINL